MKVCKGLSIGTRLVFVQPGLLVNCCKPPSNSVESPTHGVKISVTEL